LYGELGEAASASFGQWGNRETAEAARETVSACRLIALTVLVDCTAYLPKRSILTSAVEGIFVCDMPVRNRDHAFNQLLG
jgi:hypothetical protein